MLCPWLYNVFMYKCINNAYGGTKDVLARDVNVHTFLSGGDAILLTKNLNGLKLILDYLKQIRNMDPTINLSETKVFFV